METNNIGNLDDLKFLFEQKFLLQLMKNKKYTNVQKSPLLGRPAGPIVYVLIANSLMQYSEMALSAVHLEKVITYCTMIK